MSAIAAGSMLMWMAGLLIGAGTAGENLDWILIMVGVSLSCLGLIYIKRFAEPRR